MSNSNNKRKAPKIKERSKPAFQLPPVAIIDNIVLTKREAWAVYTISEKPYLFLSTDAKVQLGQATMTAIGSLCQSANKKIDCQLLTSNQPFEPEMWENDIIERYLNYNKGKRIDHSAFEKFITAQADSLYKANYQKRVTYLAVKLGNRGALDTTNINPLEFGFKDAFRSLRNGLTSLFKFQEEEITADEEKKFRAMEETVYNTLSAGSLACKRPSTEEVLLTIKRRLYPAMPAPYLETDHDNRVGLSDIVLENGSEIEEFSRYVKITQIQNGYELSGCRATLSFSKFPKDLAFPSVIPPFLHRAIMLPFTVNCRFSLLPTEEMKQRLYKKQLSTEDEINNLADSNQRPTASLRETINSQNILEKDLEEEGLPWIVGNYRITLEAPTFEDIKVIAENIRLDYSNQDFVLSWTAGDQLDLLKEEFFGGNVIVKDFSQITNLALLGLAGINYGGTTGDPVKQQIKFNNKRRR